MDWRHELGLFAKKNAELIRARIADDSVHAALDRGDEEAIGREVMICVLRSALSSALPERSRRVKETMLQVLENAA